MASLEVFPLHLSEDIKYVGGIDEVGRGSFAGPVVSALVILPKDFTCDIINDSKKLSDKKRREAYQIILDNAIDYSVQSVSVKTINKIGIDKATFLSMEKCIKDIQQKPDYLLIDGNRWDSDNDIPFETVPKGDSIYMSIAAASIIAKVQRDDYMIKLSELYPQYNWQGNKGYCCSKHKVGLKESGACDYHRTQFVRNWI
jgi:ribonuclease HII